MGGAVVKLLALVAFATLFIIVVVALSGPPAPPTTAKTGTPKVPTVVQPNGDSTAANPYLSLSPDKVLEQGRSLDKRMKEANDPDPKRLNKLLKSGQLRLIEKKEVDQTRAALESLTSGPQRAAAAAILTSLNKREEEGRKAEQAFLAKAREDDVTGRKEYASDLETRYLKAGTDMHISTAGAKGTTLVIRYVLIGRPFVFNTLSDEKIVENWKGAGFSGVRFTDGYSQTWTCDLGNLKCR
jgi:hypothetical protein